MFLQKKKSIKSVWYIPSDSSLIGGFQRIRIQLNVNCSELWLQLITDLLVCFKEAPSSVSEGYRGISRQRPKGSTSIQVAPGRLAA